MENIDERIRLITSPPIEEVITIEELRELLSEKKHPHAYDGFEPSGLLHLASGLMRALKIKDLLDAGCEFTLLLADYHAVLNNKMGGDLAAIRRAGEYFIEGWKACGLDTSRVKVRWASDLISDPKYWETVIKVASNVTVARMTRCTTIMGREESELRHVSQLLYPAMQVADIFYLDVDICQLGLDQRRANMLARELAPTLFPGRRKPVCVHHHMLSGLKGPSAMGSEFDEDEAISAQISGKMSKSKPQTSVFIHDSPSVIKEKISQAFCPEKSVEGNAVLELAKYIVFKTTNDFTIERPEKYGGNASFQNYEELESAFVSGKLHPQDLKNAVSGHLVEVLEPVRAHFEKDSRAAELLEFMTQHAKITR